MPFPSESSSVGMGALQPVGRVGEIEDVVGGVLYLESAPFVTGEILHIDGGPLKALRGEIAATSKAVGRQTRDLTRARPGT
jgi:hypothetical protein